VLHAHAQICSPPHRSKPSDEIAWYNSASAPADRRHDDGTTVGNTGSLDYGAAKRVGGVTILLWILAAVLEGIDLQSAGIAGPAMAREFGFNPLQMGRIFGISTAGLALSAAFGGHLADRFGRKRVLVWAVVVYGVFSLATAQCWDYSSMLLARALTGVGLGAAIPNLIALVFESTPMRRRNTMVGVMYCGMPLGSALAAAIGWMGIAHYGWRLIFYCGGLAPVLVAPLLARYLDESPAFTLAGRRSRSLDAPEPPARESALAVLMAHGRARTTLTLWFASFSTYFVLYLLLSWLPTLLVRRGFSDSAASAVLVLFNFGGIAGISVSGLLMDRWKHRAVVLFVYAGLIAVLLALAQVLSTGPLLACAFLADFFAASSQMIQYGLAPLYYPVARRGMGVGSMVAVGRTGAIAGPVIAGQLLALGAGTSVVLSAGVPAVALSAVALLVALMRAPATHTSAGYEPPSR
jgi:AAHS family 3-hydroxyphenylpropionic acid transporter